MENKTLNMSLIIVTISLLFVIFLTAGTIHSQASGTYKSFTPISKGVLKVGNNIEIYGEDIQQLDTNVDDLYSRLGNLRFGVDNGKYGYIKPGESKVNPF